MMFHSKLAWLFFFVIGTAMGQEYVVSGVVLDEAQDGVPFANVFVMRSSDSTMVKGGLTEEDGRFSLDRIAPGTYYVSSSMIGYQEARTELIELQADTNIGTLILSEGESLEEVVVTAQKPLYSQKVDRLVINVASSIVSSGGTALEILERSPGVVVNRQSSAISVVGKEGVVVMINGKISYVPTSNIVQMLEGMSADNIESIELITSPPSSLDAEGNAGYINIVLKESTDLGLNGSYSLSAGYGEGATSNDNINFNYRKDKINLYGSYSFLLDKREQFISTSRMFQQNDSLLSTVTVTDREPTQRNHNARLGLDVQATEKTIFGVLVNAFDNKWTMDAFNESFDGVNGVPISFVDIDNTEKNQLKHFGVNVNMKHDFSDKEYISMDVDYLFYEFDNPTDYLNTYFDADGSFLFEEELRSRKDTPLDTWVAKADYSNAKVKDLKMEFGVKATLNDFENDVSVENLIDGVWVIDPTLTNMSVLDEGIYAAYASGEYNLSEKTTIKAGMRYEYTDTKLDTDTEGTVVDRQYGIFFPNVFLSHQFKEELSMNWAFNKRITRPTFNDLAPFVIFFDPNTFLSGNAALQPATSESIKWDINWKSYFLSFQYTDEDNTIANFQERIDEETGRLIFEAANLDYTRTFSIIAGIPIKITNWWKTQNNLSYINQKVRSFYDGVAIEQQLGIFSANSTMQFKISEKSSAELSGFYNGPGFFGNARYDEVYGINMGLQHKFSEKWGTLKFSITDILDSVEFNGGTKLPEQNIVTSNTFDFLNRTYTLTYTRNFGNSKLQASRNRQTGSEEERRRVN